MIEEREIFAAVVFENRPVVALRVRRIGHEEIPLPANLGLGYDQMLGGRTVREYVDITPRPLLVWLGLEGKPQLRPIAVLENPLGFYNRFNGHHFGHLGLLLAHRNRWEASRAGRLRFGGAGRQVSRPHGSSGARTKFGLYVRVAHP